MTINEQLSTEVAGEYDVIVVGGGPSGAVAGIAAAREGAKTLVLEREFYLGGMWTGGLVNPLFDYHAKDGILAEIIEEHKKLGSWGGFGGMCFSYENMKRILEDKLTSAGGEVLFGANFSRALVEGNRVCGVVCECRGKRMAFLAKYVIDCTGDAEVATSAGCKFEIGRPSDNLCQAMTLMFTVGNIEFMQHTCDDLRILIEDALKKNDTGYRLPYTRPYIIQIPNSKTAVVQLTHMRGYDPFSGKDIASALIEGRKQAYEVVEFLKNNVEQFKDIELLETAPLLGIRESRRIVGEYVLTKEDCIEGRRFEDEVTTAAFNIDIHDPLSDAQQCYKVKRYGIPLGCLIPKGYEGIFVAGRSISGTHEAMASYRVTGNCAAMGEYIGRYAAKKASETH